MFTASKLCKLSALYSCFQPSRCPIFSWHILSRCSIFSQEKSVSTYVCSCFLLLMLFRCSQPQSCASFQLCTHDFQPSRCSIFSQGSIFSQEKSVSVYIPVFHYQCYYDVRSLKAVQAFSFVLMIFSHQDGPSLVGISCPLLGRKINGYICCVRDKINTDYAYYYENNLIFWFQTNITVFNRPYRFLVLTV